MSSDEPLLHVQLTQTERSLRGLRGRPLRDVTPSRSGASWGYAQICAYRNICKYLRWERCLDVVEEATTIIITHLGFG